MGALKWGCLKRGSLQEVAHDLTHPLDPPCILVQDVPISIGGTDTSFIPSPLILERRGYRDTESCPGPPSHIDTPIPAGHGLQYAR
jgi:hypothetical protein